MIGYVYKTTNLLTGKIYIGKHKSPTYDKNYYGSGRFILEDIKRLGIENFSNEILVEVNTIEDLNQQEQLLIAVHAWKGYDMYNIAMGGDGGDTYSNRPEKEKEQFVDLMTDINRKRCGSKEFKEKTSKRMHEKYLDPNERQKQADNMNAYWNDKNKREEQRIRFNKYKEEHPEQFTDEFLYKPEPCGLKLPDGTELKFNSKGELQKYMTEELNYTPDSRNFVKMLKEGAQGIPKTFFHSRFKHLDGLMIYELNE